MLLLWLPAACAVLAALCGVHVLLGMLTGRLRCRRRRRAGVTSSPVTSSSSRACLLCCHVTGADAAAAGKSSNQRRRGEMIDSCHGQPTEESVHASVAMATHQQHQKQQQQQRGSLSGYQTIDRVGRFCRPIKSSDFIV